MFRPKGDPRGVEIAWSAPGLALLFVLIAHPLAAQVVGRVGDSSRPVEMAQKPAGTFGPEERAQELYLDAMEKLSAGLDGPARNMLGDLLTKYPQTEAATLARHQLGELEARAVRNAAAMPPATTGTVGPSEETSPTGTQANVISGPRWDQELRRNGAIQARLRMDAGDRVFFGPGSAELGSRARQALAAQARWLNRWSEFEAAIEGHADEPGSDQEDLKLSLARAEAVRKRLVSEGVAPSRLAIVAQGNTQPVAVCDASECRAQNRRVVTLVFAGGTSERLGLSVRPAGNVGVAAAPAGNGRDSLGAK